MADAFAQRNDVNYKDINLEKEIIRAIDGQEDEDGNLTDMFEARGPNSPTGGYRYHTGPKGVIADAREHAEKERLQKGANSVHSQEHLKRLARGKTDLAGHLQQIMDQKEEEEEEDEAFKKYRLQRMRQLRATAQRRANMPTFGKLYELDTDNFVEAVDRECYDTYVIVHLHEEHLASCVRLNYRLSEVAEKYDQVKFCTLSAAEAGGQFGADVLPALLVYKATQLESSLFQVDKKVFAGDGMKEDSFARQQLEELLELSGVMLTSSAQIPQQLLETWQRTNKQEESASEDEDEQQQQGRVVRAGDDNSDWSD